MRQIVAEKVFLRYREQPMLVQTKRAGIAPGSILFKNKSIRLVADEFYPHQADFLLGVVVLAQLFKRILE